MLDAGNLWELLDARVAATPDAVMAIDQDGRSLTFAEYRAEAERAAAGLAKLGIGEGDVVSWQLPTWLESLVLVAALSRLGAIQNPMLPIYRQREVGFVTQQAGTKLLHRAGHVARLRLRGDGHATSPADQPGLEVLVADHALPQGDPSTLPPAPAAPDDPADLPVRWYYYTSGTTADPKGAQHTDASIKAAAIGMCERLEVDRGRPHRLRLPVHPRRRRRLHLQRARPSAARCSWSRRSTPRPRRRSSPASGVTLAGAGTPFHMAYLAYQRNHPDAAPLFPTARAYIGGGAPKPPQLHYDVKAELGGVGIVSGYGMTEAPIVTMASVRRHRRGAGRTPRARRAPASTSSP